MSVAIRCEQISADQLRPGDLFSIYGPAYWDNFEKKRSLGEKVYIRTHDSIDAPPDPNFTLYRITIERGT